MSDKNCKFIGKKLLRKDAKNKVTGEARYVYDLHFADELYLQVIRSPYAHADITKININYDKIQELRVTIGTAAEVPGKNLIHVMENDWPLLAEKTVNHVGEPVAILVGPSTEAIENAKNYIKIEYEELPAVYDPLEAINHPEVHIYGIDNVCSHWQQKKGDIEKGFAQSEIVIENEYRTPAQEHAYLETQGCIAVPLGHDEITIYGSMQSPFYVQGCVAETLGIEWSKVNVIQTTTGGAFGGKEDVPSQIGSLAALGAWLTKKPVKYVLTREEDIETTSKRHPAIIRYKTGVTATGVLNAVKVEIFLNTGAYATLGPAVLFRAAMHAVGPYRCDNVDVQAYAVTTNLVPFGAFRGFGAPQVSFASEEQMDRVADVLKLDPSEFRELNILSLGDETSFGQKIEESIGLEKTLHAAREQSNWYALRKKAPSTTKILDDINQGNFLHRGIGLSTTFYGCFLGASGNSMSRTGAYVQLEPDGSVRFSVGTIEMGQGMITVLSQIVAEELGIDYEKVHMSPVDTSRVPDSGPTAASRATVMSGRALQDACRQLRQHIFEIIDENNLTSMSEAIKQVYKERGRVAAHGWDSAPPTYYDNEKCRGEPYLTYVYSTTIVEVEVDSQIGTVNVLNIWSAHDIGKAINPQTVEGQIEGGTIQGLGFGRYEHLLFTDEGRVLTNNLGTYLVPTINDTPDVHPIIIEEPWTEGPYGAKSMGEPPIIGVAPALTSAIANAIGIRLNEIPATPERVWSVLQDKIRKTNQ